MNRDDVIRMAREAGFRTGELHMQDGSGSWTFVTPIGDGCIVELERFAALVAAAERRKHQAEIEHWKAQSAQAEKWRALALCKDPMQPGKVVQEIQREAMELERDACAILCDMIAAECDKYPSDCAFAIRARGNQ